MRALLVSGHAQPKVVVERILETEISEERQQDLLTWMRAVARPGRRTAQLAVVFVVVTGRGRASSPLAAPVEVSTTWSRPWSASTT